MGDPLFLGIDAGQTTVKAVVHDQQLRPVAMGRRASPVDTSGHRAERSQDALWGSAAEAVAEAVSQVEASRIAAVGLSGHGDGLYLVDADGRGVGPGITAMDTRARENWQRVVADPQRMDTILQVSGQQPPLGGAGVLLAWLKEHQPELVEQAAAALSCKDILRQRLVGGPAETDLSDATASFLDMHTGQWSPQVLEAYGLDWAQRLLPKLRQGDEIAGEVSLAAAELTGLPAGVPVVMGLHDVQASAIGSAALTPGRLSLVAGSFSTNGVTTEESFVDRRWQCRASVRPGLRIAMSTSATASPALSWAVKSLGGQQAGARDMLFAEAAAVEPWQQTPDFLPYVQGSPISDAATGTLAGIRSEHSRGHVFRGVLEGIAFMHLWHTRALGEQYSWETPLRLGGGLSRAGLYAQLVADALAQPISVVRSEEAGAMGAAAVAGCAVGHFSSLNEAQQLVELDEPMQPRTETAGYWQEKISRLDSLGSALTDWWEAG